MGQTKAGAIKAQETIRQRYGDDWFKIRAAKGGRISRGRFKKGDKEASEAGMKGVSIRCSKK